MSSPIHEIVDRKDELDRLRALVERSEPQLALLYGRRRLGKTYLLSRMWDAEQAFYFTASETTSRQNRQALLAAFAEWSSETVYPEDHPTWRSVFRLLLDHRPGRPLVIVLDEFQYLGESERDLNAVASELNAAWESHQPSRQLLFVIAGSSIRLLQSLNEGGSPLYGRFAMQHRLRPFDYWHAGELAGFDDLRDRAVAYGVFGGTPRYLAPIVADRPLSHNVTELMLAPSGEVRELVQTALHQEQGLRTISTYVAILRAIGHGRTELNDIAQSAGVDGGPALRDKLVRLTQLDYIESSRNLGARPKEAYRYRVSDPAMRFYYEFIAPLESALATQNPATVWDRYIAGRVNAYMGFIFETIVEEAYYRLADALELPLVLEWGRWEGVDRNREPVEIDIASRLADGRILTGAIKWSRKPIDANVHFKHVGMIERLAASGVAWAHDARTPDAPLLYVASGGFTDEFRQAARAGRRDVYVWQLEDLYAN